MGMGRQHNRSEINYNIKQCTTFFTLPFRACDLQKYNVRAIFQLVIFLAGLKICSTQTRLQFIGKNPTKAKINSNYIYNGGIKIKP